MAVRDYALEQLVETSGFAACRLSSIRRCWSRSQENARGLAGENHAPSSRLVPQSVPQFVGERPIGHTTRRRLIGPLRQMVPVSFKRRTARSPATDKSLPE